MKPRIVRENATAHLPGLQHLSLDQDWSRPVWLALPWPPECPWTPEQVMAACERKEEQLLGVPMFGDSNWWILVAGLFEWRRLTPEFIAAGEPKCEHKASRGWASSAGLYEACDKCGAILSDRRYYTQRKGERRNQVRRGFDPKVGTGRRYTADRRSS